MAQLSRDMALAGRHSLGQRPYVPATAEAYRVVTAFWTNRTFWLSHLGWNRIPVYVRAWPCPAVVVRPGLLATVILLEILTF